ncbi:transmembrane protein 11, mitochondrial isoform X1 [Panulirus ornatus]|uniref:transmembrane protein 11, mitochondrial isoform X1 n=1 Tax=Panulirus ornatus TaxID=150431 RepID=UPI003A86C37A
MEANISCNFKQRESCSQIAIIREVYDSDSAHETFELELERALEKGVATIVIEPTTLGDETARWIAVGNCLHKTAVLAGFGAITSGLIWHDTAYVCVPLGTLSLFCTGVYAASWQFDPCCKYQVEYDSGRLSRLPLQSLSSASPVVLVRRDDSRRKILHSCVSLVSFSYCMWRLYQLYK